MVPCYGPLARFHTALRFVVSNNRIEDPSLQIPGCNRVGALVCKRVRVRVRVCARTRVQAHTHARHRRRMHVREFTQARNHVQRIEKEGGGRTSLPQAA